MTRKKKNKKEKLSEIELLHPYGLKGLLTVYDFRNIWKNPSFYLAAIIGLLTFFALIFGGYSSEKLFELTGKIVDTGLSLDGGLIGLSLAGLTLIVTFGSEKLLKAMVMSSVRKLFEKKGPTNSKVGFSGYQTAVSKFGFAVFVQVISLIALFFYNLISKLELSFTNDSMNVSFNSFYLSMAVFLIIYSFFLVVQMTINIFTISQMNHSVYFSECVKEFIVEHPVKP
ncbi:MAG: hypothetical protein ACO1N0_04635 [Fluviicola sp.]